MRSLRSENYDYPQLPPGLESIPTIGETVFLNGATLQTPNPTLVSALQALDPRVHYFPTDRDKARSATQGYEYNQGVVDLLAAVVLRDFPGPIDSTAQRGTVLSIRDEFPHYAVGETLDLSRNPTDDLYLTPPHTAPMLNVLTALRTGSDRGGKMWRTGTITLGPSGDPQLYSDTAQYIKQHINAAFYTQESIGNTELADTLFPVLLVYDRSLVEKDAHGYLIDPSALVAAYITDRILYNQRAQA